MSAEDHLRRGDLAQALAGLQEQVREDPANAKHRIFLFQLLALMGRWERAMTQLKVSGELDPGALAMVQAYREALKCEVLRQEVFAGRRSPLVFGEPAEWVALMVESLKALSAGREEAAGDLRDRAFAMAPAAAGSVDGRDFTWIADGDTRLGPILEALIDGKYYWVPFSNIRRIEIEEPRDLRDLVWMPAHFQWTNGGESVGLIPTRYPESHADGDSGVVMARKTVWEDRRGGSCLGRGQRMLATDAGEHPLMDVRSIILETGGEEGAESRDG